MRHVDAKIKILLVLFYYYNFTFVSIINCDRQKFSIVTLHESKVHYAIYMYGLVRFGYTLLILLINTIINIMNKFVTKIDMYPHNKLTLYLLIIDTKTYLHSCHAI